MMKYLVLLFLIPICLLNSCNTDRLAIDVSNIDVNLQVKRLDQAVFPIDTTNTLETRKQLEKDYGTFTDVYLNYMLQTGGPKDSNALLSLAKDPVYKLVMTAQSGISEMEADVSEQMELLENGFRHLKHYYPEAHVPEIVLMNSWFQYGIFTTDSTLAIGLDFFVNSPEIQKVYPPQFYAYMKRDMRPEYISINAMYGWLTNKIYPISGDENTLLDQMVYKGKLRYMLEAMYPGAKESVIMNYSEKELAWCYKKQLAVWLELSKVNDKNQANLYEVKKAEINKWISPGPFTSALSEEATDRMGGWIGLQMVRDFMKENPEVTLPKMLKQNSRKFLKHYNPKR